MKEDWWRQEFCSFGQVIKRLLRETFYHNPKDFLVAFKFFWRELLDFTLPLCRLILWPFILIPYLFIELLLRIYVQFKRWKEK